MAHGWQRFLVLEPVPATEDGPAKGEPTAQAAKHPGLTWHDHLVMLLHVAAEIEHSLMVQYLYAAYSLGGPDAAATPERQTMVKRWQTSLLKVAKEEMGHFLTVQNILCLIGAPVHFGREDYPWSIPYYPFPFRLEKLTRTSLACYVYAEMSPHILEELKKYPELSKRFERFIKTDKPEIDRLVKQRAQGPVHMVAAVYHDIVNIIKNENLIPDSAFNEESYASQASWDDWGRSYGPVPRWLDPSGTPVEEPKRQREANLIIMRAATRTEALAALNAISGQGESIHVQHMRTDELSHFERFLKVYQEYPDDWLPARDIPDNPTTRKFDQKDMTYIDNNEARYWATLFNYRYRLLLTCLAHSFRLAKSVAAREPNLRGMVMHRAFGEMYNIKTVAGILVGCKLHKDDAPGSPRFAGPPFEMPYTLTLPEGEADAWRLHQEFLNGSIDVTKLLLETASGAGRDYLVALEALDRKAIASIDALLAGLRR